MRTFLFSASVLLLVGTRLQSSDEDAETHKLFAKAVERAEIHSVAVYESIEARFKPSDVTDWPKLIVQLQEGKSLAHSILTRDLPNEIDKLLSKKGIIEEVAPARPGPPSSNENILKGGISAHFTNLLRDRELYSATAFKAYKLSDLARKYVALGAKRTAWQTAQLNWELITLTFPKCIADASPNLWTVRVRVRSEKDVILVLAGTTAIRWDVEVTPGSRVTGVILCGYGPQDIELYENPVKNPPIIHRAHYSTTGATREYKKGEERFGTYEQEGKEFVKFVNGVKGLTGKEFASFQGGYRPKPKEEPFLVPPKK